MSAAPVSYYDMTLDRIRERLHASDVSPAYAAVALRITRAELEDKLSGAVVLTVREIHTLAETFGCPMSEIVA
ncbi:hypothetical protein J2X01_000731 [Arthrobacter ginsengisoli]|uniref:XRE family transcriptional regulator n=1 Tax=Arthrobacter ginsengisoli TaxID=1356565 RepID=A0ABU1U8D5_9MICC|nr:hypothetical protein [Arthrobacter ginsengisoli]MDR7081454.1 hypothetical protein [Arthrobacter ginsengisoli]